MNSLLRLALYILAAILLAWLVLWGCQQIGFPSVPSMIGAGVVFILVLVFGLRASGTADV
jgi:fatty acid desaturase